MVSQTDGQTPDRWPLHLHRLSRGAATSVWNQHTHFPAPLAFLSPPPAVSLTWGHTPFPDILAARKRHSLIPFSTFYSASAEPPA